MPTPSAPTTRRAVALRDGTLAELRPVKPDDLALVAAAFESLSPASRYMRFHRPMPHYSQDLLAFLVATDGEDHVAWMAHSVERCIGVARFIRLSDPSMAELAITVVDGFHGRGLGRALVEVLAASAAERSIQTLKWVVHPENRKAIRLMRSLHVAVRWDGDALIGLQPVRRPARPAVVAA